MRLEYSENEKREKLNTVAEIVCAIILGCACFFVFTSMFGLKYSAGTMTGGVFSQGIARIWDNIADTLGNLNYTILPKYKAGANEAKSYGFALTVILAMMSVISYLIIKSRVKLMLAAPIIPLVIMIARFGVKPSVYAGAALAGALVLALALMNIKGKISPAYFAVPLAAVCILERAAENRICGISPSEALPMLLQQAYRPMDAAAMERTLGLIDRLAGAVRLFRLGCNMDIGAAKLSYETMKG